MDIERFQQNLLEIDVWEVLTPVLNQHLDEMEQLNRQQLSEGVLADGNSTPSHSGSPMSELYVESKIERGVYDESLYPKMNFYNKGDFYKGITAFLEEDGITFDSNDDKVLMLESRYSKFLMGLTKENLAIVLQKAQPKLIEALKKEMFK